MKNATFVNCDAASHKSIYIIIYSNGSNGSKQIGIDPSFEYTK